MLPIARGVWQKRVSLEESQSKLDKFPMESNRDQDWAISDASFDRLGSVPATEKPQFIENDPNST